MNLQDMFEELKDLGLEDDQIYEAMREQAEIEIENLLAKQGGKDAQAD